MDYLVTKTMIEVCKYHTFLGSIIVWSFID